MAKLSQFDDADGMTDSETEGSGSARRANALWVIILILLLAGAAGYAYSRGSIVNGNRWQTVFLTNGQAYFGHLAQRGDAFVLTNVFYLRTNPNFQPTTPSATAFDIVKLGGELHGPESTMYIPESGILFWEDMRTDSQVVTAIENFLKTSK